MKDLQKSLERTGSNPIVARDTKYYLENIGKVKTVDEFVGNHRLYSYAMKASGLEDMIYAKAFMKKVLNEGIDNNESFANRLSDKRYKEFATVFNFARYGELATTFTAAKQGTVDNYIRQSLEKNAGEDDQGVRLALYFARKASEIKNPFDILADPALLQVVQTALGIPKEASLGSIDAQAAMIKHRLDIETLKDPKQVDRFLKRFTILWDAQNNAATSPVLTLFTGASPSSGLGAELLVSLQNIKRGGI
ncbi:DUF1217 domain-containing protein [Microvirga lenta]|uniref:DUF1217 domain-containing protein n=1 Tax=Microvirga lenta TaxID=2881337 RepID=UPI00299E404A|nr:DUF1217 domain-containing protein [Microvirga lenta]